MTLPAVQDLIPHRGSMLLIDKILEMGPNEIICQKEFRPDEFFFDGHYPDSPLVPGVILCECAAQAAAALLANQLDGSDTEGEKVPVLTRMNKVRFKNTVHPHDVVQISATLNEALSGAWFLSASIRKSGKLAAALELACTLAPKPAASDGNSASMPPAPRVMGRSQSKPATVDSARSGDRE